MTTKHQRTKPLWDSLRRRDALEQAERRDRKYEKHHKIDPSFKKEKHNVEHHG